MSHPTDLHLNSLGFPGVFIPLPNKHFKPCCPNGKTYLEQSKHPQPLKVPWANWRGAWPKGCICLTDRDQSASSGKRGAPGPKDQTKNDRLEHSKGTPRREKIESGKHLQLPCQCSERACAIRQRDRRKFSSPHCSAKPAVDLGFLRNLPPKPIFC